MPKSPKSLIALALVFSSLFLASCARHAETLRGDELLAAAWNEYSLGEFDRAVMKFEAALAAEAPDSERAWLATYGLATTWNLRLPAQDQDKTKAAQLYQSILDRAPNCSSAPWADLGLARMKHLVPVGEEADYAVVRPAYQRIIDKYPGHLVAREAFIYLMSTKIATLEEKELREAIARLQEFVSQTNDTSFFQPAYSLMAVSFNALNMQAERLEAEIKSLDTNEVDPSNPYNEYSWQYWNIATIAEFELGDFDTARTYYRKLLDEYPRDRRIYGVKQALKRMDEVEEKIREEM